MSLGAYVLPGDPAWLRSSLSRYLDRVDVLVVPVPRDGRGWLGTRLPVEECLAVVEELDTRGVRRIVPGQWTDRAEPRSAEVAQRQDAIRAMPEVDWVLQIDNDEVLPSFARLEELLGRADQLGLRAVEWPMRVLYRRLRDGTFLEVVSRESKDRFEYPGPIAVRPDQELVDARRTRGAFLRPLVVGDSVSPQLRQPLAVGEHRVEALTSEEAILHNSWARPPAAMHEKVRSTSHRQAVRTEVYYWWSWWLSPLRWRWMRDFHPLYKALWPRLRPLTLDLTPYVLEEDLRP